MNPDQLRYLAIINDGLGGPIYQAIEQEMPKHLLACLHRLLTRVIVDASESIALRKHAKDAYRELLPELYGVLADDKNAGSLAERLQVLSRSDEELNPGEFEGVLADVAKTLLERRDCHATSTLRMLVDRDCRHWQHIEDENAAINARAAAYSTGSGAQQLSPAEEENLLDLLRKRCSETNLLAIARIEYLPGGFSKQSALVHLVNNHSLPDQIVLRRDLPLAPSGSSVVDEFDLLKVVYEAGVKVPKPWVLDVGTVLGSPIMVVSKVEGRVLGDAFDIPVVNRRPKYAVDLAYEMAKIHSIPIDSLPGDLRAARLSTVEFVRDEIDAGLRLWRELGRTSIVVDVAFHWLLAHIDYADGRRSLLHRDLRFHNVLTDDKGITAILDWETAIVGNPASDLCYAHQHVAQLMDWEQFLRAYADGGGVVPSPPQLRFYSLWMNLWCLMLLVKAQSSYLSGATDNVMLAFVGEQMRQKNMLVLAQQVKNVVNCENI